MLRAHLSSALSSSRKCDKQKKTSCLFGAPQPTATCLPAISPHFIKYSGKLCGKFPLCK